MAAAVGSNQFGMDAEFFTRGTGDDKPRGESMVSKHLEKLQQEKENVAMEKLTALMPTLGAPLRVLALKESVFDVETALSLLRSFQTQNDEVLKTLHKKRKKIQESAAEAIQKAEEEAAAAAAAAESGSSSGSDDDSSDDSSDSGDKKKRKRKSKKSSKDKKKRKGKDKDKDKERDKKKRKKDKGGDSKAKAKALSQTDNFGRFGIIRETDANTKHAEFTLWAIEVKHVNIESLGKADERELFRDFMEDYNTGTLPHRKFYNLQIYEREKAAKYAAKHGKVPPKKAALDDEEQLRRQKEEERAKQAADRLQQALAEMPDKAKDMREQELLRMQMQAAYKTGDKAKAEQIYKQLMSEDEKMAKGIIKWKPKQ